MIIYTVHRKSQSNGITTSFKSREDAEKLAAELKENTCGTEEYEVKETLLI